MVGCIEIMDNVFVGAHTILLPNIRIGPNVIIGAGSLVTKDCQPGLIYAGSPARPVGSFEEFVKRRKAGGYAYTKHNQHITDAEIDRAWLLFMVARGEKPYDEMFDADGTLARRAQMDCA